MNALGNLQNLNHPEKFYEMDSSAEEAFDRLTRMAARLLKVPVTLISFFNEDKHFVKSESGLTSDRLLTHSFCEKVVKSSTPLIIPNATLDTFFKESSSATAFGIMAYIGIPLILKSGTTVGTFCAFDYGPRNWSTDEIGILTDLAKLAVGEIEIKVFSHTQQETLAIVSHDLKNPLFGIELAATSSINLLKKGLSLDPKILKSMVRIKECAERMQDLIRHLLDEYCLDSSSMDLEIKKYLAHDLVKESVDTLIPIAEEKGVILHMCDDLGKFDIFCDHSRMIQIISNLVGNAIQFTPAGKMVRITGRMMDENAFISISDEGPGIPEKYLNSIFDKFWQHDKMASPQGHGLGLYIVSKLIKAHRGDISVNTTNKGTTFTVKLPHHLYLH